MEKTIYINIIKTISLVLGATAAAIGWHAHFGSQSRKERERNACKFAGKMLGMPCPPIFMEYYFLYITITTVIVSSIFLIKMWVTKRPISPKGDICFHVFGGILLMVGGSFLIVSADQIWNLVKALKEIFPEDLHFEKNEIQLYDEKYIAGIMTIVNGVCYLLIGLLLVIKLRKALQGTIHSATNESPTIAVTNESLPT